MQKQVKTDCGMSEKEALHRLQNGDAAGMARLYELYKPWILSFCLHYIGNSFDAEDVTQEVFIQVFRNIGTFRGEAEFKSWIYKIALNSARLHARQQRRHTRFLVSGSYDEGLASRRSFFYNPTQTITLIEALSTLTHARLQTLLLRHIHGLTHTEIAKRIGVSVIASKSRLHQAHVAVRRILRNRPEQFTVPRLHHAPNIS